jgi:outer membrane protein assembly factor BamB
MILRNVLSLLSLCLLVACSSNTDTTAQSTGTTGDEASPATEAGTKLSVWPTSPNVEGVAIGRGVVYAGHFGPKLQPNTQDGDGYIATYDANGQLIDTLVYGLDAPKGLEFLDNQVFVADVDTLFGFSSKDGSQTFAVSFAGMTNFLNGLVAIDENTLLVSATDAGKVWKVTISTGESELLTELTGANGLARSAEGDVIYAVQYLSDRPQDGHLYAIDLNTGKAEMLGDYGGMLDGVFTHQGAVYFTDWNPSGAGKFMRYDLASGETSLVVEDSRMQGPADFEILNDGLALIPMLTGSRIMSVKIN